MSKMCNQETTSIRFDTLEKICLALNCTPDDLFESTDKQFNILINKEDGTK
ncbi:helix-turn-helix domain-containing protein [Eubacterium ramulus]|uniref:helix-turn-helix domain-containing protein n=1 Tax=Eubacterium ramulus TaxID=39490 RepID=UPI00399A7D61